MIPHHCEFLSPVIYLVQMQVPLISSSTQRRQAFLIDHLPLAVFSTPLNFKICPSPQSHYSVLSVPPHRTPSLESLDSKRGVVLHSHIVLNSIPHFLHCLQILYLGSKMCRGGGKKNVLRQVLLFFVLCKLCLLCFNLFFCSLGFSIHYNWNTSKQSVTTSDD